MGLTSPVQPGKELTYEIRVTNKSTTATYRQIRIAAALPQGMTPIAEGSTAKKIEGQLISVDDAPELAPGKSLTYRVRVQAKQVGNYRLHAELTLPGLQKPISGGRRRDGGSRVVPRFVILRHDSPRGEHFDFMLEAAGVLKTWALPRPPEIGVEMECEALADHRIEYLDYEGAVSGDRGTVTRWDCGTYLLERQGDAEWIVQLVGKELSGRASLFRLEPASSRWRVSFQAGPSYRFLPFRDADDVNLAVGDFKAFDPHDVVCVGIIFGRQQGDGIVACLTPFETNALAYR